MTATDGLIVTDRIGPIPPNTPGEKAAVARLANDRLNADDAATVIAALALKEPT